MTDSDLLYDTMMKHLAPLMELVTTIEDNEAEACVIYTILNILHQFGEIRSLGILEKIKHMLFDAKKRPKTLSYTV